MAHITPNDDPNADLNDFDTVVQRRRAVQDKQREAFERAMNSLPLSTADLLYFSYIACLPDEDIWALWTDEAGEPAPSLEALRQAQDDARHALCMALRRLTHANFEDHDVRTYLLRAKLEADVEHLTRPLAIPAFASIAPAALQHAHGWGVWHAPLTRPIQKLQAALATLAQVVAAARPAIPAGDPAVAGQQPSADRHDTTARWHAFMGGGLNLGFMGSGVATQSETPLPLTLDSLYTWCQQVGETGSACPPLRLTYGGWTFKLYVDLEHDQLSIQNIRLDDARVFEAEGVLNGTVYRAEDGEICIPLADWVDGTREAWLFEIRQAGASLV